MALKSKMCLRMGVVPLKVVGLLVNLTLHTWLDNIAPGTVLPPVAPRTDLLLKVSQCCHLQNRLATAFNTAEKKTSENDKLCTVNAGYGSKLVMCRPKQINLRSYLRFLNVSEIFPRIVLYISCQKSTSRRQHKNGRKPSK